MDATRLLLIRHGDSKHKAEALVGGPRGDKGLTEQGKAEVALLRDRFERSDAIPPPMSLYASTLPRAVETAEMIAPALGGISVVQDCRLCTWHTPADADGMTWADYRASSALNTGGLFRPFEEGNETWAELVTRIGQALAELTERHRRETIVVVGHFETVDASLICLGSLPLLTGFDVQVSNASITEWVTEGDPGAWPPPRWTLVRFNDTAHFPEPKRLSDAPR